MSERVSLFLPGEGFRSGDLLFNFDEFSFVLTAADGVGGTRWRQGTKREMFVANNY